MRAAWKIDLDFINEKGLLIVLALILLLACWGILYYYRNRFDDAEDWQFILRHPLAASSFVALVLFWLVAQPLPPLLRFVLLIWVVIAATRMAVMLVENRRQGLVLSLAALVFLVTSGFQLIALPQVLFRVYLALLALIFIPLLRQQIRISPSAARGQGRASVSLHSRSGDSRSGLESDCPTGRLHQFFYLVDSGGL